MKFKAYPLVELATIRYGKNQSKVVCNKSDIPIYGTGGKMGYAQIPLYEKPSVLIGRKGTIGKVKYVDHPFWTVDTLFYTEVNEQLVLPHFLYYAMSLIDLNKYNEGTTIPSLRTETLNRLELMVPSIDDQKKVLSILERFDEKITLNRAINHNLQQQIQALVSAWFCTFEPFGGAAPDNWSTRNLSDIADFIGGYAYKGNELVESTTAMATIKNFERSGGFKLDGFKEIQPSNKLKTTQHLELYDILVAHTDLTQNAEVIGNAEMVMSLSKYRDAIFSMDLVKVVPKQGGVSRFLLAALLQNRVFKAHCLGYVNGTTVLHLSKKALPEYELLLPDNLSELSPIDEAITALYLQISANIEEISQLQSLRDTLLPRLMSGEIDVSEVEV